MLRRGAELSDVVTSITEWCMKILSDERHANFIYLFIIFCCGHHADFDREINSSRLALHT